MIKYEDGCVGCPTDLGCILGNSCPYKNIPVYICDCCHEEIEGSVYEVDGEHLCQTCLELRFLLEMR